MSNFFIDYFLFIEKNKYYIYNNTIILTKD